MCTKQYCYTFANTNDMICMLATASAVKKMLSKYPKTSWWINAAQVAEFCGIDHNNGVHEQTILSQRYFFYFNMLYSRLTCIPNTGRSLNSDAAFYEVVTLISMKPITDVSVKLFFRFSVNQSNANNTASNTSDFVTVVMSFLESESRSKRECTRVIRDGRLGNKFFRSLTQRLLSDPKFTSVLLVDHVCECVRACVCACDRALAVVMCVFTCVRERARGREKERERGM